MVHDPALDAHEHAEHAEHASHAQDPFISRVSITIAVLAVVAAAAGSLESVEGGSAITASSETVLAQDKATDLWHRRRCWWIASGQIPQGRERCDHKAKGRSDARKGKRDGA